MSNEITIMSSIQVLKTASNGVVQVEHQTKPGMFTDDMTGTKGPCVGSIEASIYGTNIDFSELTTPGYCRFYNQDDTNFVTIGIEDPDTDSFYPLAEVLPGKFSVVRISRLLGQILSATGTGTGTGGTSNKHLQVRADTAACNVLVEAFEA
jgi:hypothetical protein